MVTISRVNGKEATAGSLLILRNYVICGAASVVGMQGLPRKSLISPL